MASSNFLLCREDAREIDRAQRKMRIGAQHGLIFGGGLGKFFFGFEQRAEGVMGAGGVRLLGDHGTQLFRRARAIAALHQRDGEIVSSFIILGVEMQRGLERRDRASHPGLPGRRGRPSVL